MKPVPLDYQFQLKFANIIRYKTCAKIVFDQCKANVISKLQELSKGLQVFQVQQNSEYLW